MTRASSWGRALARFGMVATVVLGVAACDLEPPPALVVTTTADGADALPGDGVCEMHPDAGDCSLRAAVEEGNALGAAAITVPAGQYSAGGDPVEVTGNLSMNRDDPRAVHFTGAIEVAAGAFLWVDGVYGSPLVQLFVHGTLVGRQVSFAALGGTVLTVGATGSVVLENSALSSLHLSTPGGAVENAGQLTLRHTAVLSYALTAGMGNAGIFTGVTGATTLIASVVDTPSIGEPPVAIPACAGTPPSSGGYNLSSDSSCGLALTGDVEGTASLITWSNENFGDPFVYSVGAASPVIDAVPAGTGGCGTDLTEDITGRARPVDGDGDAIAACDIGPVERTGSS